MNSFPAAGCAGGLGAHNRRLFLPMMSRPVKRVSIANEVGALVLADIAGAASLPPPGRARSDVGSFPARICRVGCVGGLRAAVGASGPLMGCCIPQDRGGHASDRVGECAGTAEREDGATLRTLRAVAGWL